MENSPQHESGTWMRVEVFPLLKRLIKTVVMGSPLCLSSPPLRGKFVQLHPEKQFVVIEQWMSESKAETVFQLSKNFLINFSKRASLIREKSANFGNPIHVGPDKVLLSP
jgi:hypothetical protein